MLKRFENGVFSLKTHQTFAVNNTLEKFENATIAGHFGFVFEAGDSHYCGIIVFDKLCFQNVFRPH